MGNMKNSLRQSAFMVRPEPTIRRVLQRLDADLLDDEALFWTLPGIDIRTVG